MTNGVVMRSLLRNLRTFAPRPRRPPAPRRWRFDYAV